MKSQINKALIITIDFTEEEARWLMDYISNFPEEFGLEDERSRELRLTLFTLLKQGLK